MKKIITLSVIATITILTVTTKVKAQTTSPYRVDIGVEGGIPGGPIHTMANTVVGASLGLQYNINDNLAITAASGFYDFQVPANTNTYTTLGNTIYITSALSQQIIPVKLGLKYFIIPEFYAHAEGGVGFETQYGDNQKIIAAAGIGWQGDSFDVGLRYEGFLGQGYNYGMVGLRIAYGFGFKIKNK